MPLPKDYAGQQCSLSRALEIVGERWTLLIVRDAFNSLLAWGDEHYSDGGPRRIFHHAADGGAVNGNGTCATCGQAVAVQDLLVAPGPGLASAPGKPDPVSMALASPQRLLAPVRA